MKRANVKHPTRGRRKAFIITRTHENNASESGTLVRPSLDLDVVARVWERKGQVRPTVDFLTRLGDLVDGQQKGLNVTLYYSVNTPAGKAIERVRKDAIRLVESLQKLELLDGGKNAIAGLAIASEDYFEQETLQEAVNSAFRTGSPAQFCRGFVRRVSRLMERRGMKARPHGFRSSLRTWLAEATSAPHEVAEAMLAHVTDIKVVRTYRQTDYLAQRRILLERWAGHVIGRSGKLVKLA